jgi:hypothetical protein
MKRDQFRKVLSLLLAIVVICGSFAACTKDSGPAETQDPQTQEQTGEEPQGSDLIADASESAGREDVVDESYVPIYAESIRNGTYEIQVDSSSSMFRIVDCVLTVTDEGMTADMTMGGTGYRYIYLGTPEEAVAANQEDYLLPQEDAEGAHHYIVPVEALDAGIDCAAFSDNKEKWYDRVLVFRSASLGLNDFVPGTFATAQSLGLANGTYTCEVTLAGGSGKATVQSPATITVRGGQATAEIVWSSDKYDYMIVNGVTYGPVSLDPGATFLIPVGAFDFNLTVQADTIAMSTPHLIDYTLHFDSSTIQ